jgi:gluconolactonase
MKNRGLILLLTIVALLAAASAQEQGQVIRLDAALDEIVPPGASPEKVAGDFLHLEGPVWVRSGGYLLFSDMDTGVIHKWDPAAGASIFLEQSDSNGITVDPQGRIAFAARGDRQVVRLEVDGRRTVLASRFEGKPLNRPNDLVYRSDGSLYFTDPTDESPDGSRVFRLHDGKLQLLPQNLLHPNGLAFSPDEKHLYLVDSRNIRTIYRFDVHPDGAIANGRVFFDMRSASAPGGPDGMKVDQNGNVYAPGPGGVWIISPDGKHLGTVLIPERVANLAFGDSNGKTLYLTARTSVYRIRLKIPGIRP